MVFLQGLDMLVLAPTPALQTKWLDVPGRRRHSPLYNQWGLGPRIRLCALLHARICNVKV